MTKAKSIYDHRYFGGLGESRAEIFARMEREGYSLFSIEPAIYHAVAEHRISPLLTFVKS